MITLITGGTAVLVRGAEQTLGLVKAGRVLGRPRRPLLLSRDASAHAGMHTHAHSPDEHAVLPAS